MSDKLSRQTPGAKWPAWEQLMAELEHQGELAAADETAWELFQAGLHEPEPAGRAEAGQAWQEAFAGLAEPPQAWREAFAGEKLLAERAVLLGTSPAELWRRRAAISYGGACRLMRAADGIVAVNLPRPSDWELVEAWLSLVTGSYVGPVDTWEQLAELAAGYATSELEPAGSELGLAVCEIGTAAPAPWPVAASSELAAGHTGTTSLRGVKVLDLSVMWAGPLCADLLARLGAVVTKVDSYSRPDGLRHGQPVFYERLNARKQHRTLDLQAQAGRKELRNLLAEAELVVSACRWRALEQLTIDPVEVVAQSGGVWVAITGHGLLGSQQNRIAFGDDAAAAGGLLWEAEAQLPATAELPGFVGDAIADPMTGVFAATAALQARQAGGGQVLDIPMAGVASFISGA